jgi:hypothetical protein
MIAVRVAYGETVIHEADEGERFTLNTQDRYCDENIMVEVTDTHSEDIPEANGEEF